MGGAEVQGAVVEVRGGPTRVRRYGGVAVAALLPWAWFLLRDRFGVVTDVLAIGLPMLTLVTALIVGVLGRRSKPAVSSRLRASSAVSSPPVRVTYENTPSTSSRNGPITRSSLASARSL